MILWHPTTRSILSLICFSGTLWPCAGAGPGFSAVDFTQDVKPLLAQHCFRCHGAEKQEGDFRIDTLERDFANVRVATHWTEMMDRINTGEMPPKAEPRPAGRPDGSRGRVDRRTTHRGRSGPPGCHGRESLVSPAVARRISQHDPRSAGRDLRRQRSGRLARGSRLAGFRAHRHGAQAFARPTWKNISPRPRRF